jgi:hypothetical protein
MASMDNTFTSLAHEISGEMERVFMGEFNRMRRPPSFPDKLYHFTDCPGMVSIVERRTIWASLATCLNDASEVAFGRERINSVIESKLTTGPSAFLRHTRHLINNSTIEPYVACFCTSVDRALHWLHYGRSGTGVALGFEGSRLVPTENFFLLPVSYNVGEFDTRLQGVLAEFERVIERFKAELSPASAIHMEKFAATLATVLLAGLVAFFKNDAFAAEEEWRLATIEIDAPWLPDNVLPAVTAKAFRVAAGRVVPYRDAEYAVGNLPLTEIVLGHRSAVQPKDPGLSVLLRQSFTAGSAPEVRVSSVPVR